MRYAGGVQRLAHLAAKGVLAHAHHHHGVPRDGVLHFAQGLFMLAGHRVAHGGVDVGFVKDRSAHRAISKGLI